MTKNIILKTKAPAKVLGLSLAVAVLSLALALGINSVLAWTEPGSAPPGDNVPAPINVGGTTQVKSGMLGVYTDGVDTNYGLTVSNGANNKGIKTTGNSYMEGQLWVTSKVGVGTASPYAPLHTYVANTNTVETDEEITTAGIVIRGITNKVNLQLGVGKNTLGPYAGWIQASYDNGGATHGVEPLLLNPSGGNLGIGTTSPGYSLQVNGTIASIHNHQDKLRFSGSHAGIPNTILWDNDQGIRFWDGDNGELVRITNTGSMGIGTTNPGAKLEVAGQIKITGGTPGAGKVLTSDANGLASWQTPAGGLPTGTVGQTLRHDGTTWVTNSVIYNDGTNVGIGTTSPGIKLEVNSGGIINTAKFASSNTAATIIIIDNTAANGRQWELVSTASDASIGGGKFGIVDRDAGLYRLVINSSGNVGIGTTNPGAPLQVNGNVYATAFRSPSGSGLTVDAGDGSVSTLTLYDNVSIPGGDLTVSGNLSMGGKIGPTSAAGTSKSPAVKGKTSASGGYGVWGEATGANSYGVYGKGTLYGGFFDGKGYFSSSLDIGGAISVAGGKVFISQTDPYLDIDNNSGTSALRIRRKMSVPQYSCGDGNPTYCDTGLIGWTPDHIYICVNSCWKRAPLLNF